LRKQVCSDNLLGGNINIQTRNTRSIIKQQEGDLETSAEKSDCGFKGPHTALQFSAEGDFFWVVYGVMFYMLIFSFIQSNWNIQSSL
jgi:hypothetical protein